MDSDKKSNLLRVVLSRKQTQESVRKNLLEGRKYLQDHGRNNVEIEVVIRGFEGDARHPACIKDAKRCFVLAFEEGLAGLILDSGSKNNLICEVYSMAYLKGKVKMKDGKRVIKFQASSEIQFATKVSESCDAYLKLIDTDKQVCRSKTSDHLSYLESQTDQKK